MTDEVKKDESAEKVETTQPHESGIQEAEAARDNQEVAADEEKKSE